MRQRVDFFSASGFSFRIGWLWLGCILLASCTPVYIPNAVNVPLLGGKGEANIQASLGTSMADIQAAVAVTDHFALMANGSFGSEEDGDHLFLEGGAGYFKNMGKAGRYEMFAGYGWGRTESTIEGSLGGYAKGNYNRFFIQPSIGAATENFDGAFSLRLAYVDFFNTESFAGTDTLFIEPVLTGKVGFKFVKLVLQVGISVPFRKEVNIDYQPLIFNLGLNFNLGRKSTK